MASPQVVIPFCAQGSLFCSVLRTHWPTNKNCVATADRFHGVFTQLLVACTFHSEFTANEGSLNFMATTYAETAGTTRRARFVKVKKEKKKRNDPTISAP